MVKASLKNQQSSLLTTHRSLLTAHCSLLTEVHNLSPGKKVFVKFLQKTDKSNYILFKKYLKGSTDAGFQMLIILPGHIQLL